jgi:PAS domain S-box-containing protein
LGFGGHEAFLLLMSDPRRRYPATLPAADRRILLIDDSPDDAAVTCELLAVLGWDPRWAGTYDGGLEALSATSFAAVLLDYDLGDRTGIELACEAMRRDIDAPIVLLTGESGEENVVAAARAGAAGYLVKGTYDVPMLERTLRYAIEHRRVEREVATRARRQVAVAELSRSALRAATLDEVFQAAMVTLAEVMHAPYCELIELVGPHQLERRAGFGDLAAPNVLLVMSDRQPRSLTDFIVASAEPVVIDDLVAETRFLPPATLLERGVRSGVCAPLHGRHQPHGILQIFADTPGRFAAEDALFVHSVAQLLSSAIQRYQSEAGARAAFNCALDAMAIVDDVATILDVNDAACTLFGAPRDVLVGSGTLALATCLSGAALQALWSAFLATGNHRGEYCVNAGGGTRVVEISATANIGPGQHFAVMRDVTEKRRAEEELRRSEASFRQFLDAAADAILAVRDGRILYANPRASVMFGYLCDELIGMETARLVVREEHDRVFAVTRRPGAAVGESASLDWTCQRKDGSRAAVESNLIRCLFDGEAALLSYCRDITERVATARRRGRVLVIDDDVAVAAAVRRALQAEHDVVAVYGTEEALDRLVRGEAYDVILCDLMTPQTNGADLFAALAARAPASAERVIFMSGGAFSAEVQAFLAGVANPRIDKPFDIGELRALVRERVEPSAA